MFFDGLDEIFKRKDKIEIKNDIENFHTVYKDIYSFTTSRKVGYEEAKLKNDFLELHIQNFDPSQVKRYVRNWYSVEEEVEETREKEIEGFLERKKEIDTELLQNPLLLSLIVILYRNLLKLPESKLEIYQSCTRTLVDKWDASKELVLDIDEKILKNKENLLADLAYWQYTQMSSEDVEITHAKALRTIKKSIEKKLNIEDEIDAEDKANSFMRYTEKRTIYFDNNFTHKTFLEYYTAYWIYTNVEKKHNIEERNRLIAKYISNPFWHSVLELLLNMIDKDQPDTEIVDKLLDYQLKKVNSLPFILSSLPSLKNVGENQIYKTIDKSVDILIRKAVAHMGNKPSYFARYGSRYMSSFEEHFFSNLKKLNFEGDIYKTLIRKVLREKENQYPEYRLQIYILFLEIELGYSHKKKNRSEIQSFFSGQDIVSILKKNKFAYRLYLMDSNEFREETHFKINLEFFERYGFRAIIEGENAVYDNLVYTPLISYLRKKTSKKNLKKLEDFFGVLKKKGIKPYRIIETFSEADPWLRVSPSDEEIKKIIKYLDLDYSKEIKTYLLLVLSYTTKSLSEEEYEKVDFLSKYSGDFSINKILKMPSNEKRYKYIMDLFEKNKI